MLGKLGKALRSKRKENKGFTLLELIIVIAIIAILLALLVPNLSKILGKASKTSENANAKTLYTSASTWASDLATDRFTVANGTITISAGKVSNGDNTGITVGSTEAKALESYINDKKVDGKIVIKNDYSITSVTCNGIDYPTVDTPDGE